MTLRQFKPQVRNANKHKPHGLTAIANSMQRDGYSAPMVAAADGEVFAGSARLEKAAEIFGTDVEPIIVESDGTRPIIHVRTDIPNADDPKAKRLGVADNSIAFTDYDPDGALLALLAAEDDAIAQMVKQDDRAAEAVLKAAGELGQGDAEPQIDRAEELRIKWGTERGQLWQIGEHRLLCGDSTVRADVERVMGGDKADMVFTDPPYNVAENSRNYAKDGKTTSKTYNTLANAEWDKNFEFSKFGETILEFIKKDCAVYICTSQWLVQSIWEWMWSWSDFCSYCIWCKPNPTPSMSKRHWTWATELIPYAVRGRHISNFPESGNEHNFWLLNRETHWNDHPTEKPLSVPSKAILFSSNDGMIVYDGFAGSGTTLVACQNLNRKCRAIEISPAYCAVILERMQTAFPELVIEKL